MKADLKRAGIAYETEDAVADFHSLRAYFISALVRKGASIATVRDLARHAKAETTLKHYAKTELMDLRGAVESLPELPLAAPDPKPERMVARGTCATYQQTLGPHLVHSGDVSSRNASHTDVMVGWDDSASMEVSPSELRVVTHPDASRAERGGFEPPRPVSQSNGLANRRYRPLSHLSNSRGPGPDRGKQFL